MNKVRAKAIQKEGRRGGEEGLATIQGAEAEATRKNKKGSRGERTRDNTGKRGRGKKTRETTETGGKGYTKKSKGSR